MSKDIYCLDVKNQYSGYHVQSRMKEGTMIGNNQSGKMKTVENARQSSVAKALNNSMRSSANYKAGVARLNDSLMSNSNGGVEG